MQTDSTYSRLSVLIIVSCAALAATAIMNITALQYEPLDLWVRAVFPLLIFIGIYGSVRGSRAARILGWLGIGLFILCALQMIIPGEDYISGGPDGPPLAAPRLPSHAETAVRFIVFITVVSALFDGFRRLSKLRQQDKNVG